MSEDADLNAAAGFVEPRLQAEFPGLAIVWITVTARTGPSPRALRQRLRALSDRYRGASVVAMRTHAIPRAYRTFYRHIGLDPDVDRIPSEEVAVSRLLVGGLNSRGLLHDALLVALVETGVPVWALDADLVDVGGLGVRTSVPGDAIAGTGQLAPGRLVVADAERVHALLFGPVPADRAPGPGSSRIALYAVGVDGVPAIHLEEALWVCREALRSRREG
jgi:DNA/RNA-binding domain of Phe-tRNA-synthetase-like protein